MKTYLVMALVDLFLVLFYLLAKGFYTFRSMHTWFKNRISS